VGIDDLGHVEADRAEGLGHQRRVVLRVGKRRDCRVAGVADNQGNAVVRMGSGRRRGGNEDWQGKAQNQGHAHLRETFNPMQRWHIRVLPRLVATLRKDGGILASRSATPGPLWLYAPAFSARSRRVSYSAALTIAPLAVKLMQKAYIVSNAYLNGLADCASSIM